MVNQQQPKEPADTATEKCNVVIFGIRRKVLKISPHYRKRNEEFQKSKKKKVRENLSQWLLDDKVIKNFVKQLEQEDLWFVGIHLEWPAWKYYGRDSVID